MQNIARLFPIIKDPDPWGKVVNPIWAALLEKVEEARGALRGPHGQIVKVLSWRSPSRACYWSENTSAHIRKRYVVRVKITPDRVARWGRRPS